MILGKELVFEKKEFHELSWTYPDYQLIKEDFKKVRNSFSHLLNDG